MDDIGRTIDAAVRKRRYKLAILIAVRSGWLGLSPILASSLEDKLDDFERVEIVEAFAAIGDEQGAVDLRHRWRVSRLLSESLKDRLDGVTLKGANKRFP